MDGVSSVLLSVAPLLVFMASFLLMLAFLFWRDGVLKLRDMVAIFLERPATLKTWGLFLCAPAVLLLVNAELVKIGNDPSWPREVQVALARIEFYRTVAIGLELILSIIVGAFGAVAFKGQLPGGASLQVNQDGSGSMSGPAPVPPVPPAPPIPPKESETPSG